ncbi:class I SAM-dependent methyltransferase [Tenggerimyces flavus]|uniref:Class I SAM-dependent methyltransferase n=1 Tax=Tenggerimyces flavus TaxID=1708749 RepID=A0ABV7Y8G3_9ACTN|nr:SAM-dependent methyltransferase [Tenggerimyces flavus]MBM7785298.1 SAM-dependent methyltransferase [Tenggerimyces flavus]
MPEALAPALDRIKSLVLDDERLVRAVAAGRRKGEQPSWRRAELRYVELKSGRHLQLTTYDQTQAFATNVATGDQEQAVDALLSEPFGNWHVETTEQTVQLRVTKKGEAQVHTAAAQSTATREHDRQKDRVIQPTEPFLHAIGITDAQGRVKPTRQDKYRQVEEFVRNLDQALEDARATGQLRTPSDDEPWRVVDLGCGNAYLTFAAYSHLSKRYPIELIGIDVKEQARERNTKLAADLGWSGAMRFEQGEIATAELDERPDIVLALHACDTATDDALARAVRWQAALVLAAPCCHHDLQRQLKQGEPPAPYALVARNPILRERLADMLTDALRAAVLRLLGYRVDVVEFVDSAHTPRNLLLRAVRTNADPAPETVRDYGELTAAWGVRPALARLLEPELGKVLRP